MKGNLIFSVPSLFKKLLGNRKNLEEKIKEIEEIRKVGLKTIILRIFSKDIDEYSDLSREEIIEILFNDRLKKKF